MTKKVLTTQALVEAGYERLPAIRKMGSKYHNMLNVTAHGTLVYMDPTNDDVLCIGGTDKDKNGASGYNGWIVSFANNPVSKAGKTQLHISASMVADGLKSVDVWFLPAKVGGSDNAEAMRNEYQQRWFA
jgi:hypothetical protein